MMVFKGAREYVNDFRKLSVSAPAVTVHQPVKLILYNASMACHSGFNAMWSLEAVEAVCDVKHTGATQRRRVVTEPAPTRVTHLSLAVKVF